MPQGDDEPTVPPASSGGFELEPEVPIEPPGSPLPGARDAEAGSEQDDPTELTADARVGARAHADADEGIDRRTLAERLGKARTSTIEALPPPPDWPAEVFQFPLRPPGSSVFMAFGVPCAVLDLTWLLPQLSFLAILLKLGLLLFLIRAQRGIIGQSAAGADTPQGWERALEVEARVSFLMVLVAAGSFVLPIFIADWIWGPGGGALALLVVSLYGSVVITGLALGDRRMLYPWHALAWLCRRPLAFAAGAVGWWVLYFAEPAMGALAALPFPAFLLMVVVVRAASLYAVLVSTRVLGVVGRSWTPWGYEEA